MPNCKIFLDFTIAVFKFDVIYSSDGKAEYT